MKIFKIVTRVGAGLKRRGTEKGLKRVMKVLWKKMSYWRTVRSCLGTQMVKNLPAMPRPLFSPWVGKIPWRGNGYPLQYCLENPMDQGARQAADHGVAKGQT